MKNNITLDTLRKPIVILENDVHIWLVNIQKEMPNLGYLSGILSYEELDRAGRFVFDKDRHCYIISHGILRLILSRYIRINAKDIKFSTQKKGKPILDHPEFNNYMFNLSHANNYVIYGITRNKEVGIDIEYMRLFTDCDILVNNFFSKKEINEYFNLPESIRKKAFFTCWTRKEAFVKAIGDGLYFPLNSFSVSPNPNVESEIEIHDYGLIKNKWSLQDIKIEDSNYVSAIVIEGDFNYISYWNWN